MRVYTLAFREDAGPKCTLGPEHRLEMAAELMATMGRGDVEAVVALPAGYVVAPSSARRDEWAEGLAAASRSAGVGIVFGIDVAEGKRWGVERCLRSFAYASDRGRRLFWAVSPTGRSTGLDERTVSFGGMRTTVLFGRELFAARSVPTVEAARPELVVVLGHAGPTKRWLEPLMALDELAPTIVVHQALPVRRPAKVPPPRGWRSTIARGPVQVTCYRREADGAATRVVGN